MEAERRAREKNALRLADLQPELARCRAEVRLRSSSVNSPRTHKINISLIGELLSHFDGKGGTYDSWKRQVILSEKTYNLDEDITRILIGSRLKNKALIWFHSRFEHIEMTTKDLLTELGKMFYQRPNKVLLRKQFEERSWKRGKSSTEYIHNTLILANRVPIDEAERVDYIIDELPDPMLRNHARKQCFKSMEALLAAFEKVSLHSRHASLDEKHKPGLKKDKTSTKLGTKDDTSTTRRVRCFNCSKWGHISLECDQPPRNRGSCFRCSSSKHIIRDWSRKEQCSFRGETSVKESEVANVDFREEVDAFLGKVAYEFQLDSEVFSAVLPTRLDGGSPISFIKQKYVSSNVIIEIVKSKYECEYSGINDSKLKIFGSVNVKAKIGRILRHFNLFVVDHLGARFV